MKSICFLLFFFGIILIIIGYYRNFTKNNKYKEIEYRYIPKSLYAEQMKENQVMSTFKKMFQDKNIK